MNIRLASRLDLPSIVALLDAEGLPHSDLAGSGTLFLVAVSSERIIGCCGIEPYGETGIIRSLTVDIRHRGTGVARALVTRAEALAGAGGIRTLFLLTESSMEFWNHAGYGAVSRSEAPRDIRESSEFTTTCPQSATCMMRSLDQPVRKISVQELELRSDDSKARFWEIASLRARLTYYDVPAHALFPIHFHDGDQITFVQEGELAFEANGERHTVRSGEAIVIPTGTRHAVTAGETGARAFDAWSHPMLTLQSE